VIGLYFAVSSSLTLLDSGLQPLSLSSQTIGQTVFQAVGQTVGQTTAEEKTETVVRATSAETE
jgi:hypothetical protein